MVSVVVSQREQPRDIWAHDKFELPMPKVAHDAFRAMLARLRPVKDTQ